MVALLHRADAGAGIDHHTGALVAEDGREEALGNGARAGEPVGVAHPGRHELDQAPALLGPVHMHRLDR